MGINPAVYMANYYLFWYELKFVSQLRDIICNYPPQPGNARLAKEMLLEWSQEDLSAPEVGMLYGNCAQVLLHAFRFVYRYVDDLTSGPNQYLPKLLYDTQFLLSDNLRIFGIYPARFLTLEPTPGLDLYNFTTLDLHIVTKRDCRTAQLDVFVYSNICLYDKRRLPCYRRIPIVLLNHVSSNISLHAGYNVALSQLHRFATRITDRDNYVLECARLLKHFTLLGYSLPLLFRKLRRHLAKYHCRYGDTSWRPLWHAVRACLTRINVLHAHDNDAWRFATVLLPVTVNNTVHDDEESDEWELVLTDSSVSDDDMDITSD